MLDLAVAGRRPPQVVLGRPGDLAAPGVIPVPVDDPVEVAARHRQLAFELAEHLSSRRLHDARRSAPLGQRVQHLVEGLAGAIATIGRLFGPEEEQGS